jgi:phage gp16-like protein
MKITAKQIALIQVAKKRLNLDDADYRAILMRSAGVTSSKDLDAFGLELVMAEFARLGFESDFAKANLGRRAGMASLSQVAKIRGRWNEYAKIAGFKGDDKNLGKWLERFGVSSVRFLPQSKVNKVFGGLAAMIEKKKAA